MTERSQRYNGPSETCIALEPELTACASACERVELYVSDLECGDPITYTRDWKTGYVRACAVYYRAKVMLNRKSAHLARVGLRESLTLVRERAARDNVIEKRERARDRRAAPLTEPGLMVGTKRWASMPVFPMEVSRMRRLGDV